MKNDLELIVHKLPRNQKYVNLYPIGDVHVGSENFSQDAWNRWKKMVKADPHSKVVYIGDLLDNGLKNSKTNSYLATMQPEEQKNWWKAEFKDFLAEKLLGGTVGNHEERSVQLTGSCPLYDIMCKFDIEDLYRPNGAFIKISLGHKSAERQWSYVIALGHGATKGKKDKFGLSLDGIDALISGHTHTASTEFPSKLVVDSKNDVIRQISYVDLVVPSMLSYGGYGLKAMYTPKCNDKFPILRLSGKQKDIEVIWR